MSEYFLAKYQPIADALLSLHGMSVDDDARDMLADTITKNRELPRNDSNETHSPIPAARKARKHARKLLEYARRPPRSKTSVPTRCASLRTALLSAGILAVDMGVRRAGAQFDYGALLDSLETQRIDEAQLAELVMVLDAVIADPKGWQKVGRPWGLAKPVVRGGCMAWRIAGHRRLSYRWDDGGGKVIGPLPQFLRSLIACCNGTHELIRNIPRERQKLPKPRGDGLHLSDESLKLAIIECAHDDDFLTYLERRAQKRGTYLT